MKKTLTQKIIFSIGIMISVLSFIIITACNNPAGDPVWVIRGYIEEPGTGVKIPIYQTTGVSDADAIAAAANIIAGYFAVDESEYHSISQLEGKIKEIRIVKDNDIAVLGWHEKSGSQYNLNMPYSIDEFSVSIVLQTFIDEEIN